MLFQMRFRTLFRAFLLLTAQVGSNFVIISTNSWDCYKFGITVTIASPKGIQKCFFDFNVFTLNIVHPRTFVWGVRECVVRESACMACKRSAVRFLYSPPKKHRTS